MASRIFVAVIGIPLLLAILLFCPPIGMTVVIGLLSGVGAYELTGATGFQKRKSILTATALIAFLTPFWFYFERNITVALGVILLFLVFLFSVAFSSHETVTLGQISGALLAGVVIPAMFSSLVLMTELEHYRLYLLLPFVSAFTSDAAALFVGMRFGRHKLAPVLSPHKTVEGAVGGLCGSTLCCAAYGLLVQYVTDYLPSFPVLILYGLLGSVISQFGDLAFSYVKRQFDIKDYGHLFLAHGGVLDRFDSVIFCAPLTAVLADLLPFFSF